MRKLIPIFALLAAAPAWALEGPAPVAAPATASAIAPAATPPGAGKSVHLGKIEATGMKPLVQTLQEIKLAVKRPFDDDPAHRDDMVCRLGDDGLGSHLAMTLECGTQGWFSMQRSAYGYGGVMQSDAVAVSALGHPWHVVRPLDMRQLQALRAVLKGLPQPGKGDVQVIQDGQRAPLEPSR